MKYKIAVIVLLVLVLSIVLGSHALAQPSAYNYVWKDTQSVTCDQLTKELGVKVTQITRGEISEGVYGTEISFERQPTAEQLQKLDLMMPELKRDGAVSLADQITQLKNQVAGLQTQIDTLTAVGVK
jgi:(p)ppGpp synthase/HD superfamily hydrolase